LNTLFCRWLQTLDQTKKIYQKPFMESLPSQTREAWESSHFKGETTMIKISCDVCSKVRPQSDRRIAEDAWVLGYDIEIENANALQRSLRFLSRWDDARVLELGAIHLCSEKCKDQYIKEARAVA
jgi:hypothetical protein